MLPRSTCLALLLPMAFVAPARSEQPHSSLQDVITALDAQVFDAFNRCSDAAQLQRHAGFFAGDVEFYHDTGGVTWTREAMIDNTRRHACGRYTRQLVPGSLRVSPIKDFGAIAQGVHRFCQVGTGEGGTAAVPCEGEADFVMLWRHRDGKWEITRVLSYGHRPSAGAP